MAQHETRTRRQSTVTRQEHEAPGGGTGKDGKAPRRLRLGSYKSFRPRKKAISPAYEDRGLPSSWKLFKRSLKVLWRHKKLFWLSTLIFGLINLTLAGGFLDSTVLSTAEEQVTAQIGGDPESATTGLTLLGILISAQGGNSVSAATGAYQMVLVLLVSLVVIWGLRQVAAKRPTTLRGAWYQGTAPLVPFTLVILVLLLELLPFTAGSFILTTFFGQGIAVTVIERLLTLLVFFLLTTLSVYWVLASMFAMQIVTLPGMTPVKALKSANELVRYRRGAVLRKVLFLLAIYVFVALFFVVPLLLAYLPAAAPVFFFLSTLSLPITHAYLYNLYRELIG